MPSTKAYTYHKQEKREKILERLKINISKRDIVIRLIGIFIAMGMPLPGVAPFGMAYLAQEKKFSYKAVFSFLAVSLGSIMVCPRLGSAKYIASGAIYLMTLFVLEKGVKISDTLSGIIAAVSVFLTGLGVLFIEGFSFLSVLLLLCEAAMVVSGTLMMEKCVSALKNRELFGEATDSDTKLSLAAVSLVTLLGFSEVYLGSDFSVMNCFAVVILLMVSAGSGAGYATAAGIVLGVVCGMGSDFFMPILGAFGFCGFLAGAFSKFGKGGAIAGVILANGIMIVYTNSALESILTLWEILAAAVIFGFVPNSVTEKVREVISVKEEDRENILKVKESVRARVGSVAAAFETMSKTMERLSDKTSRQNDKDGSAIFDITADKVCAKCKKSTICWGQNYNSTYDEMFRLLGIMKEKGVIKIEDVGDRFSKSCLNVKDFLGELNHQFDIYRVKKVCQNKLTESRQIFSRQLGGVSEILESLTSEIDSETKEMAASGFEIRSRLEIMGIRPQEVNVLKGKNGRCRVEIIIKERKTRGKNRRSIEKVIGSYLGKNVMDMEVVDKKKNLVRLGFSEAQRFEVKTDHASKAASEKNGDNFKFLNLKNGKFIIAISDGMGTGNRAAKESEAILELLDSFLRAGFDSGIAVRLINSIMIMKSEETEFVTLDVCIIDLYTGKARFIKTGAEPSFILSDSGRIRTIKSSSLPVGVIPEAEAHILDTKIQDGDHIVMVTDGIESGKTGKPWLREFMENQKEIGEDKDFAKEILNRATQNQGGTAKDDMTVLTVRLKAVG